MKRARSYTVILYGVDGPFRKVLVSRKFWSYSTARSYYQKLARSYSYKRRGYSDLHIMLRYGKKVLDVQYF